MALPIITIAQDERWKCRGCGRCCRGNIVPLHDDDLKRLKSQNWKKHPDFSQQPFMIHQGWFSRQHRLAQHSDGTCVFLDKEGLCRIHKEFGFNEKPLICRMYPLQIVPLEKAAVLTLRRSCPVAAAGEGDVLTEYLDEVRKYVRMRPKLAAPSPSPAIVKNQFRPWSDFTMITEALERVVNDRKYPIARRLVHGLWLCNLLEKCQFKNLDTGQLRALVDFFVKTAPQNVESMYLAPVTPGTVTSIIFRQVLALYLRLHPLNDIHESWRERCFLFITAMAFTGGIGPVPALHPAYPKATFTEVEQRALEPLDNNILELINDYFESNLSSKQYGVMSRPGWPLLDKYRALALSLPVAFWMLRYFSGSEPPPREMAIAIITAIDRGQGYAPLTGILHRQKISTLNSLQGLEKLIIWYAR
jgi:lysine-N-methylase